MIFGMMILFLIGGLFLSGFVGLLPAETQFMIPMMFRPLFFILGVVISFIGVIILKGRADKTGAIHLLEPGRPGTINWFYVHNDGEIKITPSMRDIESQLYSKDLDAQIREIKSYRIFDHSIRIVPEGVGHAADLDMVLYANLIRSKWGFENIYGARQGVKDTLKMLFKKVPYEELPQEHLYVNREDEDVETE